MPNIPDKDPEDLDFEELEEMGVQEGFFMLGQIRAHELATSVNVAQLCAACGIAPTRANLGPITHEVRGKVIRMEQERREGSSFEQCLSSAQIDDLGQAVIGYTNGFHAALGQLAKIVTLTYLRENDRI